jgi:hypothetical protein
MLGNNRERDISPLLIQAKKGVERRLMNWGRRKAVWIGWKEKKKGKNNLNCPSLYKL